LLQAIISYSNAETKMANAAAAAAAGLAGHPFRQVGLTVRDLPTAVAFYRDVLGLPLLFEAGGMAFFDVAGTRLMLGENRARRPGNGGSLLYFDVPALDAMAAALETSGVKFFGPAQVVQRTDTHELKLREFADPDGNVLALMGSVPR
jgi:catechol 2,3-dioxygenase-like lactoylglutathione lyase family enzyme